MQLSNKTALVTGGGRGIGRAIALALAREGADVVVAGRHQNILDEVATKIELMGRRSLGFGVDVSDEQYRVWLSLPVKNLTGSTYS